MALLGSFFRSLGDNRTARRVLAGNRLGRRLASRFVAGETLEEALKVSRAFASRGIRTALAYLSEHLTDEAEAAEATDVYVSAAAKIRDEGLPAYLSPKLTQLGLDISEDCCRRNLRQILEASAEGGTFVCVDMEGSRYTETTLRIVEEMHQEFPLLGTVLQSYLLRSAGDLERLLRQDITVRIVKGAYNEPETVAYQSQAEVEANYRRLVERALESGTPAAIATHNEGLIEHALAYAARREIPLENFEFQMLYGIRRDEQDRIAAAGFNVRVYVPFGPQWYPYFMRRLGERPANVMFLMRNLFR